MRRDTMIRSKSFPTSALRHMERWAEGSSAGLPALEISTRAATFQGVGNRPV